MADYDFQRLKDALLSPCERAFGEMRRKHDGEQLYCMALFTSGEFAYISPTGMSEEGLEAVVAEYRAKPAYAEESIEETRRSLRWSPCDSPLHLCGEEAIEPAQAAMSEVSEVLLGIDIDHGWDEFNDFCDQIQDALCDVLIELDGRGVFGADLERQRIFVTVMMGDQDDSILEYGRRVNPPAVFERFRREWESL